MDGSWLPLVHTAFIPRGLSSWMLPVKSDRTRIYQSRQGIPPSRTGCGSGETGNADDSSALTRRRIGLIAPHGAERIQGHLGLLGTHPTPRRTHDREVLTRATRVCARSSDYWVGAPAHKPAALRYLSGPDSILKMPWSVHTPWQHGRTTERFVLKRTRRLAAWCEPYVRMALASACILPPQGRHERRRVGCKQEVGVTSKMLRVVGTLFHCRGLNVHSMPFVCIFTACPLLPAAVVWGWRTRCLSHLEQILLRCCRVYGEKR